MNELQETPDDFSRGIHEEIPEKFQGEISKEQTEKKPDEIRGKFPGRIKEETPGREPGGIFDGIPGEISPEISEVPGADPRRMSQTITRENSPACLGEISQRIPGKISEGFLEAAHEKISEKKDWRNS